MYIILFGNDLPANAIKGTFKTNAIKALWAHAPAFL